MATNNTGMFYGLQGVKKNLQALKQSNITLKQLSNIRREWDVWWNISKNLKQLEGTWLGVLKKYIRFFEGVPRKEHSPHEEDRKNNDY